MATGTTLVTVKDLLVSTFTTALATAAPDGSAVQVSYAFPGPIVAAESVYLGRHPGLGDTETRIEHEIATLKVGRKQRTETYDVDLTVQCFRPDLSATEARTAEARTAAILDLLDDELANDPKLGSSDVLWMVLARRQHQLIAFEKGWASLLEATVTVQARLT